jgi:uncharacterized protein (DUF952 family)
MDTVVYKIMNEAQWADFKMSGLFAGASIDLTDGYIHLSTESQMRETAARHFSGQGDLVLIAVAASGFGGSLKYESSRGGGMFPHLYGQLKLKDTLWAKPLPLGADGLHVFPETAA